MNEMPGSCPGTTACGGRRPRGTRGTCALATFPDGAPVAGMLPGGSHSAPRALNHTESGMSETTPAPQPAAAPAQPPLVVNIQYVKDLFFDDPAAPEIYTTLRAQPQVAINLDDPACLHVEVD